MAQCFALRCHAQGHTNSYSWVAGLARQLVGRALVWPRSQGPAAKRSKGRLNEDSDCPPPDFR